MKLKIIVSIVTAIFALTVHAQDSYRMAGPYEIIARDGQHARTKGGSERDMAKALELARQNDTQGACAIINAYAHTLKGIDGHDAPLCTIQGYDLMQAMTLMRQHKTPEWDEMVRSVWLPILSQFEAESPYANGNWGAIVNRMRMACAIYLQDEALYRHAVDYYMYGYDNGSLPRYIGETGQCQETGRDQGHAQLGLEALCQTAEMAWQYRHDDLWGAYDNRLLKGVEYTARYNLGYDVPFQTWQDCTCLYSEWTKPGAMSRGKLWDIYELPYRHFHSRRGLKMPYTAKAIRLLADKKALQKNEERLNVPTLHRIITYPVPQGAPLKDDYTVLIQARGTNNWTAIDTYMAKVNAATADGGHRVSQISYAMFDFEGVVNVRVVCNKRKYKTARIRPDFRGVIANVQNDSVVQFSLFQPENVSVEFDGDISSNLLLFTSRPPVSKAEAEQDAKRQGRQFLYYAPGYYSEKDTIHIPSNTTVYLEGGSYFTGTFAINDAHDVSILGRGIARPGRGYLGAQVVRSSNVLIDGLIVNTCPIGESHDVRLHDVRSISHPSWGDGLNVFASHHITYDRVFCRNSDDCTTVYATRKGFTGNSHHVLMQNSTLWADVAHPIFIGLHGRPAEDSTYIDRPEQCDTCAHLVYRNIDILGQCEPQIDYQGCLAINCGDNNLVRDVLFENIRIEDIRQGSLLSMRVCYNSKYCAAPGRGISDITFRGVRYHGAQPTLSVITGYDGERGIDNIKFEGLRINGRLIHDKMEGKPAWYKTWDMVPFFVGNHVSGITFKTLSPPSPF